MKLGVAYAIVLPAIAARSVVAEPLAPEPPLASGSQLLPREIAFLKFCTGINFTGECKTYAPSTGVCYVR